MTRDEKLEKLVFDRSAKNATFTSRDSIDASFHRVPEGMMRLTRISHVGHVGSLRSMCSNAFNQEASAFAARTGLTSTLNLDLLKQALTHKSYKHGQEMYNERLEFLGRHVLNCLTGEFVHFKYPRLPLDSLEEALNFYAGEAPLAQLGHELGLGYAMRWTKFTTPSDPDGARGEKTVLAKGVLSLIGAIYHQKGMKPTKQFINRFILSHELPKQGLLKVKSPKTLLTALLKRQQKESPIGRILKESGRLTHSPMFIVGIFSGHEKLAEGHGSSISYAERAAVRNALIKHFLVESRDPVLPSDADLDESASYVNTDLVASPPII